MKSLSEFKRAIRKEYKQRGMDTAVLNFSLIGDWPCHMFAVGHYKSQLLSPCDESYNQRLLDIASGTEQDIKARKLAFTSHL